MQLDLSPHTICPLSHGFRRTTNCVRLVRANWTSCTLLQLELHDVIHFNIHIQSKTMQYLSVWLSGHKSIWGIRRPSFFQDRLQSLHFQCRVCASAPVPRRIARRREQAGALIIYFLINSIILISGPDGIARRSHRGRDGSRRSNRIARPRI